MPFSASQVDLFLLPVPRLPWEGHVQGRHWPLCSGPGASAASSSPPRLRRHRHRPDQNGLLCPGPSHTPSTLFPGMLPNLDEKTDLLQPHAYHAEALHDSVYTGLERVKVSSLHSRQDLLFSALFGGPSALRLEPAWACCLPLRNLCPAFHSRQATARSGHHKQVKRALFFVSAPSWLPAIREREGTAGDAELLGAVSAFCFYLAQSLLRKWGSNLNADPCNFLRDPLFGAVLCPVPFILQTIKSFEFLFSSCPYFEKNNITH